MSEKNTIHITKAEISRRQAFVKQLNNHISIIVENSSHLVNMVKLIIWHGSLTRGEGGNGYDIDYGIFIRAKGPAELMNYSAEFSLKVSSKLSDLNWRNDLHYDGIKMFEAHTHWDLSDLSLPHVGVHFYQESALNELFGEQPWREAVETSSSFFRELYSWRRFCFFMRHWVYEGIPIYDPEGNFGRMRALEYRMPEWMRDRLKEALQCALKSYQRTGEGICTVKNSKGVVLDMAAMFAYSLENRPIGRWTRYQADTQAFSNKISRQLMCAVIRKDPSIIAGTSLDEE